MNAITVIQVDRERAADHFRRCCEEKVAAVVARGEWDDHPVVQTLARCRLECTAGSSAEAAAPEGEMR